VIIGLLIGLSVVAPSFQASDLIKDILQNFLAGILLLLQEPFQLGDFISVSGIQGNVSDIQARATIVSTKEGREVVIPNAVIFTSPAAAAHKPVLTNQPRWSGPSL
jgi:hypothetical protein